MARFTPEQLLHDLVDVPELLIVQDLDGVCMQLVKDPLTRQLDRSYVEAVAVLAECFVVLTNGEHEGRRGVNRLVEQALGDVSRPARDGLYLPGLAAGGVQLQDRYGQLSHPGVTSNEMAFLAKAPERMEDLFLQRLPEFLPECEEQQLREVAHAAVLDTQVSPTINLNGVFSLVPDDVDRQRALQDMLQQVMDKLLSEAAAEGLDQSFFLHVAPNLGRDADGHERLKPRSWRCRFNRHSVHAHGFLKSRASCFVESPHRPVGQALWVTFPCRNAPRNQDLLNLVKTTLQSDSDACWCWRHGDVNRRLGWLRLAEGRQ